MFSTSLTPICIVPPPLLKPMFPPLQVAVGGMLSVCPPVRSSRR